MLTFQPLLSKTNGVDTGLLTPALELDPEDAWPPEPEMLMGIVTAYPFFENSTQARPPRISSGMKLPWVPTDIPMVCGGFPTVLDRL